jgi:hypothetical protein
MLLTDTLLNFLDPDNLIFLRKGRDKDGGDQRQNRYDDGAGRSKVDLRTQEVGGNSDLNDVCPKLIDLPYCPDDNVNLYNQLDPNALGT